MSNNQKFFICNTCGNLVESINNSGIEMVCCGDAMREITANTVEASLEKHIPVAQVEGNLVTITTGSVLHPMLEEHHIIWVSIQTTNGSQRKALAVDADPVVTFALTPGDQLVAAYAYCNLHGLWKIEL